MTAGNSTPLTDGAAAILLSTEDWARKKNLPVLAYLTHSHEGRGRQLSSTTKVC